MSGFLRRRGDYKSLKAYQTAEIIYDITYYFAHTHLSRGDRTVDQMVQAARSGKQNIAEGSAAATTSKETEIKLTNVAKASLQELLLDYEDFLRVRGLEMWRVDDKRTLDTREMCANGHDSQWFMERIPSRSAETIANIALVLLHQADFLLGRLILRQEEDFRKYGGIREQMTQERLRYRNNQSNQNNQNDRR